MAGNIKQTVEVSFITKGLETIEKSLKAQEKFLTGDKSKTALADIKKEMDRIDQYIKQHQGKLSRESYKLISANYKSLLNEFGKLGPQLIGPIDAATAKLLDDKIKEITALEAKLSQEESKLKKTKVGLRESGGKAILTGVAKEDIFNQYKTTQSPDLVSKGGRDINTYKT